MRPLDGTRRACVGEAVIEDEQEQEAAQGQLPREPSGQAAVGQGVP